MMMTSLAVQQMSRTLRAQHETRTDLLTSDWWADLFSSATYPQ